jgi:hypothetical protein
MTDPDVNETSKCMFTASVENGVLDGRFGLSRIAPEGPFLGLSFAFYDDPSSAELDLFCSLERSNERF